jgi:outer membrane protein TolC
MNLQKQKKMRASLPKNNLLLAILFLVFSNVRAQDSTKLSYADFHRMVYTAHPLAKQADLLTLNARYNLMLAKGNFDPVLSAEYNNKFFSGKTYYSLLSTMASVPLWFGPEIKAGFDQNTGAYVNGEELTPLEGLFYAGVKVPLGQGLLIDQRRAAVKQARIFIQMSDQQRLQLLNELYYEAFKAYVNWHLAYQNISVYRKGEELSYKRLQFLREMHAAGERSGMDTLEANVQWQTRQLERREAEVQFRNAALFLSVFLWNENEEPLELKETIVPQSAPKAEIPMALLNPDSLKISIAGIDTIHPALAVYDAKLESLEVDLRLKRDKLKPKLSAQYNFLTSENTDNWAISQNNYKWGLSFSMPLFLRQERGNIGMAEVKIMNAQWELDNKRNEIASKIRASWNEVIFYASQTELLRNNVRNYENLMEAERSRFLAGESTVFMMNTRESKVIEAAIKLNETEAKYHKAQAAFRYSVGLGFAN